MNEENQGQGQQKNVAVEQAKQMAEQQVKKQATKVAKEVAKKIAMKAAQIAAQIAHAVLQALIAVLPYIAIAVVVILIIVILVSGIKWLLDQDTTAKAAEIMQGGVSQYISIEDGKFKIDEGLYDAILKNLKSQGIEGGYLQKDSKYLKAMVKAELATTYPKLSNESTNLEDDNFQGIIEIIRRSYEADDTDRYQTNSGDKKELLLEYMEKEKFDQKLSALKDEFNQSDYNYLRRYYTIEDTVSGGSGTSGGTDAQGYDGLKYDSDFATLTQTPEELGLSTTTKSNVRTTVYTASAEENGGYAGKTASGIDLEDGRHIVAIGLISPIAEIGDWVCLQGKPELGYFLVCDTGAGDQQWDPWMDIFDNSGNQERYGDYNNVQVIKKADAENFIASGYVRGNAGNTAPNNDTNNTTNNAKPITIKIATYNGSTVGEDRITYQTNIEKYSVPIEFLISQLQVTDNPDYVYNMADMAVNNSKIELVIQETYSYNYTYSETISQEGAKPSVSESESESIGIMKYIRNVDSLVIKGNQNCVKNDTRYQEHTSGTKGAVGTYTYTKTGSVTYSGIPFTNTGSTVSSGNLSGEAGDGYTNIYTSSSGKSYRTYKQYIYKQVYGETSERASWLSSSGCGLTSAAIIISAYDTNITPVYLYDNYRAVDGAVYIDKYLTNAGLTFSHEQSYNEEKLGQWLCNGNSAIVCLYGNATVNGVSWAGSSGHYITMLDGQGSSGNYQVYISNPGHNDEDKNGWYPLKDFASVIAHVYYINK